MSNFVKVLIVIASVLFATSSFANSGKAMLNHFSSQSATASNQVDSWLYITNIASEAVSVKVTIYNENGEVISDQDNNVALGVVKAVNTINFSDSASYSAKFILEKNATSLVWLDIQTHPGAFGYAIVEWEKIEGSTSILSHALISHAVMYRTHVGNVGYYSVQVNNGEPF